MEAEVARKVTPLYERGKPAFKGGQGRSDKDVEDAGVWFSLFMLMVLVAIIACLFGLAGGGQ